MKGKILGFNKFKSKEKGTELINFTIVDSSVINGVGTCCRNVMGYQKDFPHAEDMINKTFFLDQNGTFLTGEYIEVK